MGLALLRTFFFFLWLYPTISKTRRMLEIRERRLGITGSDEDRDEDKNKDREAADERNGSGQR